MKKVRFLFILLIGILLVPCTVLANNQEPVKVYFFYGNGCPHCAEAEEFFDSIEDELGDQFDIVSYETWYNSDNVDLMNKVAELRKEEPEGVPYIIIGNQSWDGYASYYDDEIIDKIKTEYKKDADSRYDIMDYVGALNDKDDNYAADIAVVIALVLITSGIGFGIWYARSKAN